MHGMFRISTFVRAWALAPSLLLPALLHAESFWPQFRGPSAQGQSDATGLPIEWGADKNIVWKADIPGYGWSSPVVAEGLIFLTTAIPLNGADDGPEADRSLESVAVDAVTGKISWQTKVFTEKAADAPKIHKKNSHASPSAIYESGRVYVHFGHMGTACLNAKDGKIIWSNQAFGYKPVHGNGSSPVLYNDLLIFSADGAENPGVIALDKNTGKQVWRHDRVSEAKRKFSFCTPLLIEVAGKTQLITPGSGVVSALDPATGSEIWRVTYDQGYSVVPRPVFGQGLLFISTGYDKPSLLAIRPDGQGDVTATHIAWRADKFAPHNPSPVVVGDDLYMVADNGVLSCLNAKSGEAYFQERCTGPISASLLFADGHLYLQDEAGLGVVVKPGHSLDIVQRNPLGERSLASPAICDADLLVRTQSHLYRIRK